MVVLIVPPAAQHSTAQHEVVLIVRGRGQRQRLLTLLLGYPSLLQLHEQHRPLLLLPPLPLLPLLLPLLPLPPPLPPPLLLPPLLPPPPPLQLLLLPPLPPLLSQPLLLVLHHPHPWGPANMAVHKATTAPHRLNAPSAQHVGVGPAAGGQLDKQTDGPRCRHCQVSGARDPAAAVHETDGQTSARRAQASRRAR